MKISTCLLSLILLLTSCASKNDLKVDNLSQGILAAVLLYEYTGKSLDSAEKSGLIKADDAQKVRDSLDDVNTGLKIAISLYEAGDKQKASEKLASTRLILYSSQAILTALKHNMETGEEDE